MELVQFGLLGVILSYIKTIVSLKASGNMCVLTWCSSLTKLNNNLGKMAYDENYFK